MRGGNCEQRLVVNFAFGEEQLLLRATTRRFLDEQHALARVRAALEADETFNADIWREGAKLGWTAMLVPPELDGGSVTDQPLVDLVGIAEELGRVLSPGPFVPTNIVADAITTYGSDAQRKELPGIASGDQVAAWCLTEDGSADLSAVGVEATRTTSGFRLDGLASSVHGATIPGLLLVTARLADGGGIAHFLVRQPAVGISSRLLVGLDLTRRLAEVRFDGTTVSGDSLLGRPDQSVDLTEQGLAIATVLQAAEGVGASDHLVDATVQYAKDRMQFGRPIGSFQAIKHRLADLHITLEGMRAATYYAALAVDDKFDDATEAVTVAGSYVSDAFAYICGEALQLHGGIGFTWEHDIHLFVRRAKVNQVMYGDGSWHRERLCRVLEQDTPVEVP